MSARLPTRRVEKPWGRTVLPPPFSANGERIGEIWFEPPPELSALLVKYLFTSDKLSVQVHPPGAGGKEECWLVIEAEPDAVLGVGFRKRLSPAQMREAALDGSIERLLDWHPVSAGDFIYLPAGTVHAIGGGLSLIEVQQNSDVTYRFYDYGRPRDLHLDEAVAVAHGAPHDPSFRGKVPEHGHVSLVRGPWFRLDRAEGPPDEALAGRYQGALLAIPLDAAATIAGEAIAPGECAMAASIADVAIAPGTRCLLAQPCRIGK